jgi:hypothetical protein
MNFRELTMLPLGASGHRHGADARDEMLPTLR